AEIVRVLSGSERVEIICHSPAVLQHARGCLEVNGVDPATYRLHALPTDRVWVRDSGPIAVRTTAGRVQWIHWRFNAWAKYDNYHNDAQVPLLFEEISGHPRVQADREAGSGRLDDQIVLEGGAIDTDG